MPGPERRYAEWSLNNEDIAAIGCLIDAFHDGHEAWLGYHRRGGNVPHQLLVVGVEEVEVGQGSISQTRWRCSELTFDGADLRWDECEQEVGAS